MASINFMGGEKGDVGKPVTARVLAQYFIDKGAAFTGFDTDRQNSDALGLLERQRVKIWLKNSYEVSHRLPV